MKCNFNITILHQNKSIMALHSYNVVTSSRIKQNQTTRRNQIFSIQQYICDPPSQSESVGYFALIQIRRYFIEGEYIRDIWRAQPVLHILSFRLYISHLKNCFSQVQPGIDFCVHQIASEYTTPASLSHWHLLYETNSYKYLVLLQVTDPRLDK